MDGFYNGKSYYNEWFGGTPILGNLEIMELPQDGAPV